MRSLRFRSATASTTMAATVTAVVAALALTACGPSDDAADSKPQGSATVAATDTATDEPAAGASDKQPSTAPTANSAGTDNKGGGDTSGNNQSDKAGSGKTGGGKGGTSTGSRACEGSSTNVTVTEVSRPINHLLVTATNTGDKTCDAYYAPLLGFDDAQSTTQINKDSTPQAVVTLAPGQSAYASISLGGGDGSPTTDVSELTVHFSGRDNQGSVGESSGPITLPAGTSIADSASVTYWQSTIDLALTW